MRSFGVYFDEFSRYVAEHGNCDIPTNYKTKDGKKVGEHARRVRRLSEKLTEQEKLKLDSIGFNWKPKRGRKGVQFEKLVEMLLEYKAKYGNLLVPARYVVNGIALGNIVHLIRTGQRKLNDEEKKKLTEIGFIWKIPFHSNVFEDKYKLLLEYRQKNINSKITTETVDENGVKLGNVVRYFRRNWEKLNEEEKKLLCDLKINFNKATKTDFDTFYTLLMNYKSEFGDCLVPANYVTKTGIKLGRIVSNIRAKIIMIDDQKRKLLDDAGFVWKIRNR